jgi:peptidyl-prolyl cis-trans isomerase C
MKIAALALASVLFTFSAHADDAPAKDYTILKVNGEDVKKSEVQDVWKSIFPGGNAPAFDTFDEKVRENVLRGVASEHILLKEADKSGIDNSEEVKARIAAAKRQIVIQEFLKQKTKDLVTDDKLKTAYQDYLKTSGKEEVHARHILVKTEPEANEIEKRLKKGEDFEKLAKEKSEDKSSGAAGGDLGYFTADKMLPEFSKAAFALKKGEVSQPVKTEFGWHVIKLEDRRKATPATFDQMKDALRQDLGNKAVGEYVNGLMKNVKIQSFDANGHEKDLLAVPAPKTDSSDK